MTIRSFFHKLNRAYVSEIDRFLQHFDSQHTQRSRSQEQEIESYEDLFNRRDAKPARTHDHTRQ